MLTGLIPKLQCQSIYDIDLEKLAQQGIRGIITDLDNTLVGAHEPLATPKLLTWLTHVKERGFRVIIVSNNEQLRVRRFSEPLKLPFIYRARKPLHTSFRKALAVLELEPSQVAMIGDQMLTDVLGGNRMGLYTILVAPVSPPHEGFFTRINRRLEKIAIRRLRKKGHFLDRQED